MKEEIDVDNHLFVNTFKEHLRDLEEWGYSVKCLYPKEDSDDLVLSYDGKFRIEVIRNRRADMDIFISPNFDVNYPKKDRIAFYDLVCFLSDGKDYIVPIYYGIFRCQSAYDSKIGDLCKKFFEYYNQIEEIMTKPNYQTVHKDISKRVDILWSELRGSVKYFSHI